MDRRFIAGYVVVALVAAAAAIGLTRYELLSVPSAHAVSIAPPAAPSAAAAQALPDFATLAERYGPAVVNIQVRQPAKQAALPPELENSPFGEFFKRFGVPAPNTPQRGEGSGFIVAADGVVLTNAHVVDGASEVTVRLTDGREMAAKVVGADKKSDVAVLRIDAKGLPTVKIGDPGATRVGEWVVAIGSPYGFENSVTAGIVSAKSRSLPDESYVPFLQTDVAINPGNSGGPLFNLAGEVIGINSQIYSRTGGYQGLSFAIPIDVAVRVKDQLLAHGKVSRAKLGVQIQEVNQALADSFGLSKPTGALIGNVEKGGPADKAGLQQGDIILKYNGRAIDRHAQLPPLVADSQPGSRAELDLWRKGREQRLSVTLGELSEPAVAAADEPAAGGRLGLAVRPLTPEERRDAEVGSGVVVESVSGAAERAGIQPGDVILSLNGTPVKDVAQLRALAEKSGKTVALLVQRDNARLFIAVPLG